MPAGLSWLQANNVLGPDDAITRYLEAQIQISFESSAEFVQEISNVGLDEFHANFQTIYASEFIRAEYPDIAEDFMMQLFAQNRRTIVKIAEIFVTAPYEFRAGWPDLTLVKGTELKFVEVKTTDALHKSQIRFIEKFRKPLNLDFSVCHIYPI